MGCVVSELPRLSSYRRNLVIVNEVSFIEALFVFNALQINRAQHLRRHRKQTNAYMINVSA